MKIDAARRDGLGEALHIAGLLPRQPGGAQHVDGGFGDAGVIVHVAATGNLELVPDARRCLDADLLANDGAHHRAGTARPAAWFGIASARQGIRDARFQLGDLVERMT